MAKDLMTTAEQAELQGLLFRPIEEFRRKHGLSERAIWFFGVAFFWGYARRLGASNAEITASTVKSYAVNEQALQKAGGLPDAASGIVSGGRSS